MVKKEYVKCKQCGLTKEERKEQDYQAYSRRWELLASKIKGVKTRYHSKKDEYL